MTEVRIGGVTARFNEDGTLYLYQPDSNRALSADLAEELTRFLMLHGLRVDYTDPQVLGQAVADEVEEFIYTRGPLEGQPIEAAPPALVKRRPGRPRKTAG